MAKKSKIVKGSPVDVNKLIPFDLDKFVAGSPAANKLGHRIKFIMWTRGQLFCQIEDRSMNLSTEKFNADGKKYSGVDTAYDIYMIDEAA